MWPLDLESDGRFYLDFISLQFIWLSLSLIRTLIKAHFQISLFTSKTCLIWAPKLMVMDCQDLQLTLFSLKVCKFLQPLINNKQRFVFKEMREFQNIIFVSKKLAMCNVAFDRWNFEKLVLWRSFFALCLKEIKFEALFSLQCIALSKIQTQKFVYRLLQFFNKDQTLEFNQYVLTWLILASTL